MDIIVLWLVVNQNLIVASFNMVVVAMATGIKNGRFVLYDSQISQWINAFWEDFIE